MIAALFVERDGVYADLPSVDAWPEERDARKYDGPYPVVAHPPCARWCMLAPVNQARYGLKIGDDDGCFASALASVRHWGGVLEHPCASLAWAAFGLPRPPRRGWQRTVCGGWVCQVEQRQYGHRANKKTWLYAFGINPDSLRWGSSPGKPTAWCSTDRPTSEMPVEHMGHKERLATPIEFRNLLCGIAASIGDKDSAGEPVKEAVALRPGTAVSGSEKVLGSFEQPEPAQALAGADSVESQGVAGRRDEVQ